MTEIMLHLPLDSQVLMRIVFVQKKVIEARQALGWLANQYKDMQMLTLKTRLLYIRCLLGAEYCVVNVKVMTKHLS